MASIDADHQFADALRRRGKERCPSCSKPIDRGDVAWNNGQTEEGTPMTWAEIICERCGHEVGRWASWHIEVDDFEEFVEHVLSDWKVENTFRDWKGR